MNGIAGQKTLITGPTSGIGRQIAMDLGARGADLVLACRDMEKGRAVARGIAENGGSAAIDVMHVDTSSQRSICDFASACASKHGRLDVIVNNAGTVQGERRESVDGIEMTFATKVLGYYLLTQELLSNLDVSSHSLII